MVMNDAGVTLSQVNKKKTTTTVSPSTAASNATTTVTSTPSNESSTSTQPLTTTTMAPPNHIWTVKYNETDRICILLSANITLTYNNSKGEVITVCSSIVVHFSMLLSIVCSL